MDLKTTFDRATLRACQIFSRQKADEPVYVFSAKVGRLTVFAIATAAEAKKLRLSPKKALSTIDGSEGLKKYKQECRKFEAEHPDLLLQIKAARGLRQFNRAQEALKKMERGAEAPVRQPEPQTSEA